MTTTKYTAKITARGADSTVPHHAGAVDADIFLHGVEMGGVTLLPSEATGELDVWGDLDNWADWRLQGHLDALDADSGEGRDATYAIIEAVQAAK